MSFMLALIGFLALSAGTYRQSFLLLADANSPGRRRALLLLGYALLGLSLLPIATDPDWARRLVQWFGELSLAALLVVLFCWLVGLVRSHP
jgi:hypothetical protein